MNTNTIEKHIEDIIYAIAENDVDNMEKAKASIRTTLHAVAEEARKDGIRFALAEVEKAYGGALNDGCGCCMEHELSHYLKEDRLPDILQSHLK